MLLIVVVVLFYSCCYCCCSPFVTYLLPLLRCCYILFVVYILFSCCSTFDFILFTVCLRCLQFCWLLLLLLCYSLHYCYLRYLRCCYIPPLLPLYVYVWLHVVLTLLFVVRLVGYCCYVYRLLLFTLLFVYTHVVQLPCCLFTFTFTRLHLRLHFTLHFICYAFVYFAFAFLLLFCCFCCCLLFCCHPHIVIYPTHLRCFVVNLFWLFPVITFTFTLIYVALLRYFCVVVVDFVTFTFCYVLFYPLIVTLLFTFTFYLRFVVVYPVTFVRYVWFAGYAFYVLTFYLPLFGCCYPFTVYICCCYYPSCPLPLLFTYVTFAFCCYLFIYICYLHVYVVVAQLLLLRLFTLLLLLHTVTLLLLLLLLFAVAFYVYLPHLYLYLLLPLFYSLLLLFVPTLPCDLYIPLPLLFYPTYVVAVLYTLFTLRFVTFCCCSVTYLPVRLLVTFVTLRYTFCCLPFVVYTPCCCCCYVYPRCCWLLLFGCCLLLQVGYHVPTRCFAFTLTLPFGCWLRLVQFYVCVLILSLFAVYTFAQLFYVYVQLRYLLCWLLPFVCLTPQFVVALLLPFILLFTFTLFQLLLFYRVLVVYLVVVVVLLVTLPLPVLTFYLRCCPALFYGYFTVVTVAWFYSLVTIACSAAFILPGLPFTFVVYAFCSAYPLTFTFIYLYPCYLPRCCYDCIVPLAVTFTSCRFTLVVYLLLFTYFTLLHLPFAVILYPSFTPLPQLFTFTHGPTLPICWLVVTVGCLLPPCSYVVALPCLCSFTVDFAFCYVVVVVGYLPFYGSRCYPSCLAFPHVYTFYPFTFYTLLRCLVGYLPCRVLPFTPRTFILRVAVTPLRYVVAGCWLLPHYPLLLPVTFVTVTVCYFDITYPFTTLFCTRLHFTPPPLPFICSSAHLHHGYVAPLLYPFVVVDLVTFWLRYVRQLVGCYVYLLFGCVLRCLCLLHTVTFVAFCYLYILLYVCWLLLLRLFFVVVVVYSLFVITFVYVYLRYFTLFVVVVVYLRLHYYPLFWFLLFCLFYLLPIYLLLFIRLRWLFTLRCCCCCLLWFWFYTFCCYLCCCCYLRFVYLPTFVVALYAFYYIDCCTLPCCLPCYTLPRCCYVYVVVVYCCSCSCCICCCCPILQLFIYLFTFYFVCCLLPLPQLRHTPLPLLLPFAGWILHVLIYLLHLTLLQLFTVTCADCVAICSYVALPPPVYIYVVVLICTVVYLPVVVGCSIYFTVGCCCWLQFWFTQLVGCSICIYLVVYLRLHSYLLFCVRVYLRLHFTVYVLILLRCYSSLFIYICYLRYSCYI